MATFNNGESGLSIRTKLNNVMQHADGTTSALVFNESGADVDIRIESAGQAHAFFIDGATAHVGIGTGSPPARLSVITNNANNVSTILDGDLQLYNSAVATRAYTFLSKSTSNSMVGGNIRLNDDVTTGTHIGYSKGTEERGGAGIIFTNTTAGASDYGATVFVRTNDTNDDAWDVQESMRITAVGDLGIGTSSPVMPLDVNGDTLCRGIEYNIQPTQTSITTTATLTIAQLLTKIIQYTGAVANLTLPTGTLIEGGIHASAPNNTSFDFSVINTGSGAATLLTATGLTLVGSMVITNGTSGLFRVRKTATNTFTVYRLA